MGSSSDPKEVRSLHLRMILKPQPVLDVLSPLLCPRWGWLLGLPPLSWFSSLTCRAPGFRDRSCYLGRSEVLMECSGYSQGQGRVTKVNTEEQVRGLG